MTLALPKPTSTESMEDFVVRAHQELMSAVPEPMERNMLVWQQWRTYRGATPEEQVAQRLFTRDRYDMRPNVCVFAEHSAVDSEGQPREYDLAEMIRVTRGNNARILDVDAFSPICDGHTTPPEEPIQRDPEVLGYAGPFRLGMIGRTKPRWAVFGDEWHRKDKIEKLDAKPRRSVELWTFRTDRDKMYFDPIAALGAETPRLPLPLQYRQEARDGAMVDRYQYCLPGGGNTRTKRFSKPESKKYGVADGVVMEAMSGGDLGARLAKRTRNAKPEADQYGVISGGLAGGAAGTAAGGLTGAALGTAVGGPVGGVLGAGIGAGTGGTAGAALGGTAGALMNAKPGEPIQYEWEESKHPRADDGKFSGDGRTGPQTPTTPTGAAPGDAARDPQQTPTQTTETPEQLMQRLLADQKRRQQQRKAEMTPNLRRAADLHDANAAWGREFRQVWRHLSREERQQFREYSGEMNLKKGVALGAALLAGYGAYRGTKATARGLVGLGKATGRAGKRAAVAAGQGLKRAAPHVGRAGAATGRGAQQAAVAAAPHVRNAGAAAARGAATGARAVGRGVRQAGVAASPHVRAGAAAAGRGVATGTRIGGAHAKRAAAAAPPAAKAAQVAALKGVQRGVGGANANIRAVGMRRTARALNNPAMRARVMRRSQVHDPDAMADRYAMPLGAYDPRSSLAPPIEFSDGTPTAAPGVTADDAARIAAAFAALLPDPASVADEPTDQLSQKDPRTPWEQEYDNPMSARNLIKTFGGFDPGSNPLGTRPHF